MVTNEKHQIGHYTPQDRKMVSKKRGRWIVFPNPPFSAQYVCRPLHPCHSKLVGESA